MTQVGYWASAGFPVYAPRTFLTSGVSGGRLGMSKNHDAIGAQAGAPDRKVVSISGDGGFVQRAGTVDDGAAPA